MRNGTSAKGLGGLYKALGGIDREDRIKAVRDSTC